MIMIGRIRTVPSCEPDASVDPSCANITVVTLSLCSLYVVWFVPSAAFHSRTVLSDAADAMYFPSGENSTALIMLSWPSSDSRRSPEYESHTFTVESLEPDATHFPSGENATVHTGPECSCSMTYTSPDRAFQIRALPSSDAVMMRLLSGENAAAHTIPRCPSSTRSGSPAAISAVSQMWHTLSVPPVTIRLPSGENMMNVTTAVLVVNVAAGSCESACHRTSVPSLAPAMRYLPSGVYASEWTACSGVISLCLRPFATAQMMSFSSCDADAR
ncbi:hypothetical protein GSI_11376 [Ganoderma sinense ZZ0214-1]|uniref:Uncharacterized protein n=1 Tax=Ganoderma sinense ZZ0214-1 TaxID=1077348 RepID=A0A2G8RVU8_9APHY|nr:hypothetical protein GSI_11376 [Ganoderma sinense ZZ0214-1]